MILTKDIFDKGKSINNGWNMKQLSVLGINKLTKGWQHLIIGSDFSEDKINKFLELKNCNLKKNTIERLSKKIIINDEIKNKIVPDVEYCINKPYSVFLKSAYWIYVKKIILKRDGYKCQYNGCKNVKNLHIHHLTYVNHFNEHNNLEDLITLCKKHHEEIHKK